MPFVFDGRVGNYRDTETGRTTSRSRLLELVRDDIARSSRRIGEFTGELNNNQLSVGNWQRAMIAEIKGLHIRAATLAAGGQNGLNNRILGATGRRLRQEYDAIKKFARQVELGELSPAQIQARAKSYTRQAITAFSTSELITRTDNGAVTARRQLDPAAEHCFVVGTKVLTNSGNKNIESVSKNDFVLTRDGHKQVVDCFAVPYQGDLYTIEVNKRRITCTYNHPFLTKNRGWVQAKDLLEQDELLLIDKGF